MQSSSDNNNTSVAAAMMAALVTRRPATNEAPSHNLMRVYLDKLKELVPHCPKNRNVSKLELIQHVIDYINDLQEALQNGGSDSDSPPSSPSAGGPDPISFSEAFSHLTFDDAASFYGGGPAAVYTSDGSSDYDSRGSSPVNHQHSDGDYSSDEFSPGSCPQHQFYPHVASSAAALPYPNVAVPYPVPSYRKGFGLPSNHQQQL